MSGHVCVSGKLAATARNVYPLAMHFAEIRKAARPALATSLIAISLGVCTPAHAANDGAARPRPGMSAAGEAVVASADQAVLAQKYDEAIALYRRYLRRQPKDYAVWSKLGAAYFFTGQPRKALKNLKHVERRTIDKSYNYYFQGLCYLALNLPNKARDYLQFAGSRYTDEWGARAAFEMAILDYKAKQKDKTQFWLKAYLERQPQGPFAERAQHLQSSLNDGNWFDDSKGAPLPDTASALFKYNKLSFSPHPHYWFISGGARYQQRSGKDPDQDGQLKESGSTDESALFNMGVGVGPLRYGSTTVTTGYTYRQNWHTDTDRVDEWLADWTRLIYFPLRGDLLERRHQVYFDLRQEVGSAYFFGVYARYEIARIGSSVYPSAEIEDLRQVIPISDTQLLIPWIGVAFTSTTRTLAYLYLRKEINDNQPAFSNETFSLVGDNDQPTGSLGFSHTIDFPEYNTDLDFELFRYQLVYNDKFLDYTRLGLFTQADYQLLPRLQLSLLLGYYADDYVRDQPHVAGVCGSQPDITSGADSGGAGLVNPNIAAPPSTCQRQDTGYLVQLGASWTMSQFNRLDGQVQLIQNNNAVLEEYQDQKLSVQVTWTVAFPSVRRVARMVDRYADSAITKEPK